jgi:hypothetical protein
MVKKKKKNPVYIPNSYEKELFNGPGDKSMIERSLESDIQKKLALKAKK